MRSQNNRLSLLSLSGNLLVCGFFYAYSVAAQVSPNLFAPVDLESRPLSPKQQRLLNTLRTDSTTISLQGVTINSSHLIRQKSLVLNLPAKANFTVSRDRIESKGKSAFVWYGSVPRIESNVLLSVWDDAVFGFVTVDTLRYNIHYLGDSLQALIEVDVSKYARCGNTAIKNSTGTLKTNTPDSEPELTTKTDFSDAAEFARAFRPKTNQSSTVIDVMVAYTTAAKDGAINLGGINSLIEAARAAAQQSYDWSNISITLQVVHKVELVGYIENTAEGSSIETTCPPPIPKRRRVLEQLQSSTDGVIDNVHQLRDTYYADVVVLITDHSSVMQDCGQAYEIGASASDAFCYVAYECAAANAQWSFAHEIGHLQGARHDTDGCDNPYPEGHGHFPTGENWTTIMGIKENKNRIQKWSSPNVFHNSVATGIANTNDNVSVLNQTASTISNFRTPPSPPPAPQNLVITNPTSIGQNPILTWNASSGATSYKVYRRVSFEPTWFEIGSTTSTSLTDFTLTILAQSDPQAEEFFYHVTAVNGAGQSGQSNTASVWGFSFHKKGENNPETFHLAQNYPNPFNPETALQYSLPKPGHVELVITNLLGQPIRKLINARHSSGSFTLIWDGRDDQGDLVASGIYLSRITILLDNSSDVFSEIRKMTLIR